MLFSSLIKERIIKFQTAPLSLRYFVYRHRFTASFCCSSVTHWKSRCAVFVSLAECECFMFNTNTINIQSSLMYYCLPELNAARVVKITERNKTLSPPAVRLRVKVKFKFKSNFPFRERFLVICLSKENECNRLLNLWGFTVIWFCDVKAMDWQWNRPSS